MPEAAEPARMCRSGTWRRDITPRANSSPRGALRAHVDETGKILVTTSFAFRCDVWSDVCSGVQVSHFGPDGAVSNPILLQGDPLVNQESWSTWT